MQIPENNSIKGVSDKLRTNKNSRHKSYLNSLLILLKQFHA